MAVALRFEDEFVYCEGPPTDDSPSNVPQTIQVTNDFNNPAGLSNALPFTRVRATGSVRPDIVAINPSSADRYCLQKQNCPMVSVYGHGLADQDRFECVFFDSFRRPGEYRGQVGRDLGDGSQIYDLVVCPQIPTYPVQPMTGSVTRQNGFKLVVSKDGSAPIVTETSLPWTYTCNPCDS